jgi:predicted nucleic acid-binding protein
MRLWDASAIVPLLVPQRASGAAEAVFETDPYVIVWWATPVECSSALARLEREGGIGREALTAAYDRLRKLGAAWDEVQPGRRVRDNAQRLLRSFALRAGDALQLAAAMEFSEDSPAELEFVCFDQRLADAASRLGMRVIGQ